MYYFLERDEEIYLMFLFDKGEQEDLSETQKQELRRAIAGLKGVQSWPGKSKFSTT